VWFFLFFSPVRFVSTQLMSFSLFLLPGAASPSTDVITAPHRITLPSHWAKMSSLHSLYLSVTLCPVAYPLEPILKYWICNTATSHCYKKIISILTTLFITQPRLYFASSLARAPHHRSFTHRCRSLSSLSHAHHSSIQQHPRWRTSWPFFTFWITYRHVNLRKKIF
jgi:hypothetical protein